MSIENVFGREVIHINEQILQMFRSGLNIDNISKIIYNQLREERKQKKEKDIPVVTKRDAKNIVEKAIYESMMK